MLSREYKNMRNRTNNRQKTESLKLYNDLYSDNDTFAYDDDLTISGFGDEFEEESTYTKTPKSGRVSLEEINKKLDIALEKLAKLEKVISSENAVKKEETQESYSPQQMPKQTGSMLREIQETLGLNQQMPQFDAPAPYNIKGQGTMDMTPQVDSNQYIMTEQAGNVSKVGTLPNNVYDDDCPKILGLD